MLIVKQAGPMGKGVFTNVDIFKGQWVLAFGGTITHCRSVHTIQIGSGVHVMVEGTTRYVNHSCEPSCEVAHNTLLRALRDIPAGGEITYDYSTTEEHMSVPFVCQCGSPQCRGKIIGSKDIE